MTRLWFGTMGFSYSDWAGVFYPPGAKAGEYLSHYARHFDTVELDTTFHATPPVERVRRWATVTPDTFKFCAKTPKDVTHAGAIDRRMTEMNRFIEVMRTFGSKLGAILIQLPPSCGIDQFDSLERLLKGLPTDIRFAVEFRNASWGQQRTLDLLRQHRAALVLAEYLTRPRRILVTTDLLYIRWIGEHERFDKYNREQIDVTANLEWWKTEIDCAIAAERIDNVWGIFSNDYSGYAIATCRRFMRMMGLPVREDQDLAGQEGQGKLFG